MFALQEREAKIGGSWKSVNIRVFAVAYHQIHTKENSISDISKRPSQHSLLHLIIIMSFKARRMSLQPEEEVAAQVFSSLDSRGRRAPPTAYDALARDDDKASTVATCKPHT